MPLPFKSGYEAIEFAVKKWLMKNRPIQGLSTIPGKRGPFDVDQIQKTINTLADTFRKSGKDVNKVTVREADQLINYQQSLKAQKAKKPDFASGGIARVGFAEGKSYDAWLNYRLKEIAKGNLPVPFKEWQKGDIKMASGGIARVGFAGGLLARLYKGAKGLQHGAIERKLRKKYIETGMDKFKAYDKAMNDAFDVVNQKKLKIVENKMNEVNVHSDDYVDLIDEHIRLTDRETYKDIKRWKNTRSDLADKTRALYFPDWAKTRYGEDYHGVLQRRQASALKEQSDEINRMYPDKSDTDILVDEIDEMNKANIDEIIEGRKKNASGGIARVGMMIGGFTKAQVLIQMLKNTLKGSKDPYVKKTFPNFIKEIQANPSLANNENVWKNFTTGLPKNQRLVVHSDDSVDFFTQTEFGPHNIEKTLEFQKKHNLSRDQANKILRMEPEDRVLEMKRLETIADRSRTKQAAGGIAGQLHLNEGGRARYVTGRAVAAPGQGGTGDINAAMNLIAGRMPGNSLTAQDAFLSGQNLMGTTPLPGIGKFMHDQFKDTTPDAKQAFIDKQMAAGPNTPVETQTAQEEISWEPGQAAPEGYEVKRAYGDEWIERVEPSMPLVGPIAPWEMMTEMGPVPIDPNLTYEQWLSIQPPSGPMAPVAGTSIDGRVITQEDIDTYNFTKNRKEEAERLTEMQTRGIDPRMARSYQENIRLMGDPRMLPPMPMGGTPIDVMPPLSDPYEGLSGQEYAEKYGIPYAKGGRASLSKGGLSKILGV